MDALDFLELDDDMGDAGLPGAGLTSGEKTSILNRLTLLESQTPPTSIGQLTDVDLTDIADGQLLAWDADAGGPGNGQLVPFTLPDIGLDSVLVLPMISTSDTVAVAAGVKFEAEVVVPAASTIVDYALVGTPVTGQTTGSAVVDILVGNLASYPPTTSIVGGGAKPTISSNVRNTSSSLSGWTVALGAKQFVRPSVVSCTNLQRLMLVLYLARTVQL